MLKKNPDTTKSKPTELAHILTRQIMAQGPMSVSEFMTQALSHPEHGYYIKQDPFGRGGDFITAPEISQMFGEMVAVWLIQQWQNAGRPHEFVLVELGPGRGTLMGDVLRTIAMLMPNMISGLSFQLIETSPVLRQAQAEHLAPYGDPIFCDSVHDLPDTAPLFVIANEFFDALPIDQFQMTKDGWRERCIGFDEEGESFVFALADIPSNVQAHFPPQATEGDIFELCSTGLAQAHYLGERLKAQKGAMLVIDYGHVKKSTGDTFQAVRKHEYVSVFDFVGDADLTAHVDFDSLAQAVAKGGQNKGQIQLTDQAHFLSGLGMETRARALMDVAVPEHKEQVQMAVDRLIGQDQMGALFKVMTAVFV